MNEKTLIEFSKISDNFKKFIIDNYLWRYYPNFDEKFKELYSREFNSFNSNEIREKLLEVILHYSKKDIIKNEYLVVLKEKDGPKWIFGNKAEIENKINEFLLEVQYDKPVETAYLAVYSIIEDKEIKWTII